QSSGRKSSLKTIKHQNQKESSHFFDSKVSSDSITYGPSSLGSLDLSKLSLQLSHILLPLLHSQTSASHPSKAVACHSVLEFNKTGENILKTALEKIVDQKALRVKNKTE